MFNLDGSNLLGAIVSRWRIVAIAAGIGLLLGTAQAAGQADSYTATSKIFISSGDATTTRDLSLSYYASSRITPSIGTLATSTSVLASAAGQLGLEGDPRQLAGRVSFDSKDGSSIATIGVGASSESEARRYGTAIVDALVTRIPELGPAATGGAAIRATSSGIIVSKNPAPSPLKRGMMFAVVAAALAVLVSAWRYVSDERIRTTHDVQSICSTPVIAKIGRSRANVGTGNDGTGSSDVADLLGVAVMEWMEYSAASTLFLVSAVGCEASVQTVERLRQWEESTPDPTVAIIDGDGEMLPELDLPFDAMIVNTSHTAARTMADWAVILSCEVGRTTLTDLAETITLLERRGFWITGIVLVERPGLLRRTRHRVGGSSPRPAPLRKELQDL